MASGKTTNLELNQWAKTDPVCMEEMNENFEKLDAELGKVGNCSVEKGTYTGTGVSGINHPTTLTFSFEPQMLLVLAPGNVNFNVRMIALNGLDYARTTFNLSDNDQDHVFLIWNGNSVSYYTSASGTDAPRYQMNQSGIAYHYIAIG